MILRAFYRLETNNDVIECAEWSSIEEKLSNLPMQEQGYGKM